jgi:hypothetical protein
MGRHIAELRERSSGAKLGRALEWMMSLRHRGLRVG